MSFSLIFRKDGGALKPAEDDAADWIRRRKDGELLAMNPTQARNTKRLALYKVLCGIVAEHHDELTSKDAADEAIRQMCGLFEVVSWTPADARTIYIRRAKSIAFQNMAETEFEAFFERAIEVIHSQLLPGVDVEELRREAYLRSGQR